MSNLALEKARAAKAAADAKRRDAYKQQIIAYCEWVKIEARKYAHMLAIEDVFGRASDDYIEARHDWRQCWASMPTPPPDHAWPK